MRSFKHREKTTFGAGDRFSSTPDPRPAFYKAFQPLSHSAQGRAVSPVGTFTTGPKGTCFNVQVNDVPYSIIEHQVAPAHSRGVKRTGPRFPSPGDESSPGPIYKPFDNHSVPGVKLNGAARFNPPSAADGPTAPPKRKKLAEYIADARKDDVNQQNPRSCSFGIRHAHLEHQPPQATGVPPLGPADPLAHVPPYAGKFGSADRAPHHPQSLTASTGSHLKMQSIVDTPQWTIGRRRRQPVSATPGPGAYNIAKYSPVSKPDRPTFSRTVHDGKIFTVLGRDSPGPALYSDLALPKPW
jgi:hypothetical protein